MCDWGCLMISMYIFYSMIQRKIYFKEKISMIFLDMPVHAWEAILYNINIKYISMSKYNLLNIHIIACMTILW